MTDVLVFGSAIVDFICYVPRLPKEGETIHGNKFSTGYGGKGANQCVAATRLGANTALIAKLGNDLWGENYFNHLKNEGVDVRFVEKLEAETTGIAQICVGAKGENNIVIVVGANNKLAKDDVIKAEELFKSAKVLLCQFEAPIEATLAALKSFNGISILNAAPALANPAKELLQAATIFCVNETEAALIIGSAEVVSLLDAKMALEKLSKLGCNTVIITMGAMGAVYLEKAAPDVCIHVEVTKVAKVVDTTGAGDAFIGALAFFLAKFPAAALHQQIGAACEIAAHSVQSLGTQSSFEFAGLAAQVNPDKREFKWQKL